MIKIFFASCVVVPMVIANILPTIAGDEYPRSCLDADAVASEGRGYSGHAPTEKWDISKIDVAEREYYGCIDEGKDKSDLGYAVTGIIYCELMRAVYFTRVLHAIWKTNHESDRKLVSFARARASTSLREAKRLIDLANLSSHGLDSDSMHRVDQLYENYKTEVVALHRAITSPEQDFATPAARHAAPTAGSRSAHSRAKCQADRDAAVAGTPADAEYPDSAKEAGALGTVQVMVDLYATGSIEGVSVYRSSGNAALDNSALVAASATRYSAAIVNCLPRSGSYLFKVDFTGQ